MLEVNCLMVPQRSGPGTGMIAMRFFGYGRCSAMLVAAVALAASCWSFVSPHQAETQAEVHAVGPA
jgi:hypothetical protein